MGIDYEKAYRWHSWNKIINAVRKEKGLPLLPRNNPYLLGGVIYREELFKMQGILKDDDFDTDEGFDMDEDILMDKGLEEEDGTG